MNSSVLSSCFIESESETQALANAMAPLLRRGDCVALSGDLGAGKSTFARALIHALAGEAIAVPSPTFTLLQHYAFADFELIHADLYRLESIEDIYAIGLLDMIPNGVSLIEWPERLQGNLPNNTLHMGWHMGHNDTQRSVTFEHNGSWTERLEAMQKRM